MQALVVDEAAPRNWCRPQSDGNRRAMGGRSRFYFGCADIPHRPIRGTYVLSKAWLSDRCHVPPDAKEMRGIVRPEPVLPADFTTTVSTRPLTGPRSRTYAG